MKLPAFDYRAPATLAEALALLAENAGEARVLAGGQSLLPMMAFRLAEPRMLVDLQGIEGLNAITITDDGLRIGAKVRWCDILRDARLCSAHPLLLEAVTHIAHGAIRTRGTVGGSLAQADPASELGCVAVTCDAQIIAASVRGNRVIAARDFFLGPMSTALAPDELIIELSLPAWSAGTRWAFEEFAVQRGGFALAGVALMVREADGELCDVRDVPDVRVGVMGATTHPRRISALESAFDEHKISIKSNSYDISAIIADIEIMSDTETPADYRRALLATLIEQALCNAASRA